MHPHTPDLMIALKSKQDLQEKLALLKNAYSGETCYVLTCGPSLNVFWNDRIRKLLSNKLVFAVKHAYDKVPGIADYHVLNSWNYKEYDYIDPKPIVFLEKNVRDPKTPGCEPDLLFDIPDPSNLEKRLATTYRWDDFRFDRELGRPWGPGVMYELVIYMWVHFGIKETIVLGWDLGELNSPKMDHFFDQEAPWKCLGKDIMTRLGMKGVARKWFPPSDASTCNKPKIRPFEVQDIAQSTSSLFYWLKDNGIDLKIVSDRSLIDACVPRITL